MDEFREQQLGRALERHPARPQQRQQSLLAGGGDPAAAACPRRRRPSAPCAARRGSTSAAAVANGRRVCHVHPDERREEASRRGGAEAAIATKELEQHGYARVRQGLGVREEHGQMRQQQRRVGVASATKGADQGMRGGVQRAPLELERREQLPVGLGGAQRETEQPQQRPRHAQMPQRVLRLGVGCAAHTGGREGRGGRIAGQAIRATAVCRRRRRVILVLVVFVVLLLLLASDTSRHLPATRGVGIGADGRHAALR